MNETWVTQPRDGTLSILRVVSFQYNRLEVCVADLPCSKMVSKRKAASDDG